MVHGIKPAMHNPRFLIFALFRAMVCRLHRTFRLPGLISGYGNFQAVQTPSPCGRLARESDMRILIIEDEADLLASMVSVARWSIRWITPARAFAAAAGLLVELVHAGLALL